MRRTILISALLCACGGGSPPPSNPTPTQEPTPSPDPAPTAASVELHEWGLIDVSPTGVLELSAGPGMPARPMSVRKPVIYAHLHGVDHATLSVQVRLPSGRLLEHWPAGDDAEDSIGWTDIEVRRGVCATDVTRDLTREPCASPDGFCELNELSSYATDDHDCMRVGSVDAGLLFYRSSANASALPIRATRSADGTISVTASAELTGVPAHMLRISGTSVPQRIARADLPRAGQTVMIPAASAAIDPAAEHAAMERDLIELGLTHAEAGAFLRAWEGELFAANAEVARWDRSARRPVSRDVLLYWLPASSMRALAEVTTTPDAVLRRAILVRVDLGG